MALLIGLDVGTSSAKAVVFTDQGEVVSEGRAGTPWITTSYGVELAAEELLNAAIEALQAALELSLEGPPSRRLESPAWASPASCRQGWKARRACHRLAR